MLIYCIVDDSDEAMLNQFVDYIASNPANSQVHLISSTAEITPSTEPCILAYFSSTEPISAFLTLLNTRVIWLHSLKAGADGILPSVKALLPKTVPFTNAKHAFSASLAEFIVAAILHFNKNIPRLIAEKESKKFQRTITGRLSGKTVGFIGAGSIAKATARLIPPFGTKNLFLRYSDSEENV